MDIRETTEDDFEAIWPIFNEVVSAGETYAYPRETTKSEALKIWIQTPGKTFVVERVTRYSAPTILKPISVAPAAMCVIVVTWCRQKPEAKGWQRQCVSTHK